MHPIKLNVTRRFKLITMSKYLFPEYRFSQILKEECIHIMIPNEVSINIYIHWFEFCFFHLLKAIESKMPVDLTKQKLSHELTTYIENGGDTIDFLYNNFRKIK